jgi:hypothetical protein
MAGDAFIPWMALLFAGVFLFAQIAHGRSPVAYVGTQAGFAFLIAVVQGLAPSSDILPAIDRLYGGAASSWLASSTVTCRCGVRSQHVTGTLFRQAGSAQAVEETL